MIKTFALIARRADHSREEFRHHYEEIHAPLALPLMQGLGRYVRYHITEEIHGSPIFDVISGFWYADPQDAAGTMKRVASEAGEAIRADELTFMDTAKNAFFLAPPETRHSGEEGDEPLFVLVSAPATHRDAWLADYDEKRASALIACVASPAQVVEHAAIAAGPGTPRWDRVTEISSNGLGSLASWIAEVEAAEGRVCAVRTRRHETKL